MSLLLIVTSETGVTPVKMHSYINIWLEIFLITKERLEIGNELHCHCSQFLIKLFTGISSKNTEVTAKCQAIFQIN